MMKKIMNAAKDFVPEFMEGIELAYGDKIRVIGEDRRILVHNNQKKPAKSPLLPPVAAVTCLCFWAMLDRACWTAAPWVMYSLPPLPTTCSR